MKAYARAGEIAKVKEYEIEQYRKAFYDGTDEAWERYRANVKRMVAKFNKTHIEQIDINLLME